MRKNIVLLLLAVGFVLIAAACGEKSQEDVIDDLEKTLETLEGYKTNASMTLQTGEEPQKYDVEVWYKSPTYYRVALNHTEKDQSQIILRNEDGVFVLTPALNKSFRFQSDWPENNSQVYLYDSLMNDILMDPERAFSTTDDHYVFQTKTSYTNRNLNQQEVTLHKKDLIPASVKVMDAELAVLVDVTFNDFEINPEISETEFDIDRNMEAALIESGIPAMTEDEAETVEEDTDFTVFYPLYEPMGTSFSYSEEIERKDGSRVVLNYEGDQPFTLIQQRSSAVEASTPITMHSGEPADLGFTVGVFSQDGANKAVSWSYEGTDFFLVSDAMEKDELMAVARSVYGTHEK